MKLDFRTKAAIMLLVATATSLNTKAYVEIIMVAALVILELLLGKKAFTPVLLAIYAVFVAVQYTVLPNVPEVVSMILSMLVVNIRSFLPVAMAIVMIYRTTRISEMMQSLTKLGFPKKICIAFAIAVRYMPSLGQELKALREAMSLRRIRGIVSRVECYMVPLFISAIKTADDLTAASVTRGIENPQPSTCRYECRMRLLDHVLILGFLLFTVWIAIARYGGVEIW